MAVRAAGLRRVQIGKEVTAGTPVAANKQLLCTDIRLMPKPRVAPFRASGGRFNVGQTRAKEFSEFAVQGDVIGYEDVSYLLAMGLKSPVIAGAGPYTHTYKPAPFAADTTETLTIETGDSVRAEQASYGFLSDLQMRFTETQVSLSGKGFARTQTEGVTITAGPTKLSAFAVNPKDVTVLVGASVAGLAAITRPLVTEFGWSGWRRPAVFLNADASFSEPVESVPDVSARLVVEYNSVGSGYLTDLRAATQKFMRILASDGTRSLQITFPFVFLEADPGDEGDVYASTFRLAPQWESVLDSGFEIVVTNALSSL